MTTMETKFIQYITDNTAAKKVEDQVRDVLGAGCGWIVVDTKSITDERIREIVETIMPLCLEKEAFLLLRDKVELARDINVGGVLLSLDGDEFPSHARSRLGAAAVIGVEVNTTDRIAALKGLDVDYAVLTPFKSNDSNATALGTDGIKKLCDYMTSEEIELPRVAAGGVMASDADALMKAGCNGVATSDEKAFTA